MAWGTNRSGRFRLADQADVGRQGQAFVAAPGIGTPPQFRSRRLLAPAEFVVIDGLALPPDAAVGMQGQVGMFGTGNSGAAGSLGQVDMPSLAGTASAGAGLGALLLAGGGSHAGSQAAGLTSSLEGAGTGPALVVRASSAGPWRGKQCGAECRVAHSATLIFLGKTQGPPAWRSAACRSAWPRRPSRYAARRCAARRRVAPAGCCRPGSTTT